jgi:TRAP-type C4-dicarboxylate transport system permease small subunit
MKSLQRTINLFTDLLIHFCSAALLAMVIIIFALVISRYFFSYSFVWAEEVVRYMMIWIALLGSAILIHKRDHIRLDFVIKLFGPKMQILIEILFNIAELLFLFVLITKGVTWANSMKISLTPALQISLFWPSLIIPLSAVLMALFTLFNFINDLIALFSDSSKKSNVIAESG